MLELYSYCLLQQQIFALLQSCLQRNVRIDFCCCCCCYCELMIITQALDANQTFEQFLK